VSDLCWAQPFHVDFQATGTYNPGNKFTVELSGKYGVFTDPTPLGELTSISSGTIPCIIPAKVKHGGTYCLRVSSSDPPVEGKQFLQTLPLQCNVPATPLTSENVTATTADLIWSDVACDLTYQAYYRKIGTSKFDSAFVTATNNTITALIPATDYQWKLRTKCLETSKTIYSEWTPFREFTTLPLKESANSTSEFDLYPNPVNSVSSIHFYLQGASDVTISLYDVNGKIVQLLAKALFDSGSHELNFTKGNLAAGLYFLNLVTSQENSVIKVSID
jgi:hypothetical protein